MRNVKELYATGAAIALAMSGSAYAQESAEASGGSQAVEPDSSDIVVTAQRRSQKLTDVAASVSVVGAATLKSQDIIDVRDLGRTVSGLNVATSGPYFQPTLRGIGTNINNAGAAENTTAIYIDGFYAPSLTSRPSFSNVERIEVLKGPQGTLFGRNATAGAILITTKDPSYTPGMEMSVTAATYDDYRGDLYLTTGITDTLAANIYAHGRSADGYVKDLRTNVPWTPILEYSLRGKLLFEPTDAFRALLSVNYGLSKDPSGWARQAINGSTSTRASPTFTPDQVTTRRDRTTQSFKPLSDHEELGVHLKMGLDLGFATLNSLSQYDWEVNDMAFDIDVSYVNPGPGDLGPWRTRSRLFAQDINLTREDGPLTWVAGAFYYNRDAGTPYYGTRTAVIYSFRNRVEAYALYADGTYEFTDKLALTLGGRYSSEESRAEDRARPGGPITLPHDPVTFRDFTPRAALRYEISPSQSVYASYSEGFKSGLIARGQALVVRPEKIKAYEIGYKLARRNVRLDLAAFKYKYSDMQVTAFSGSVNNAIVLNASGATVKGIEGTFYVEPVELITLNANAAYLDANYGSFLGAVQQIPKPDLTGNTTNLRFDATGNRLIRTPKFSYNVGIDVHPPISTGKLTFSVNYAHTSAIFWSFDNVAKQKGYGLLNASISWNSDNDRYGVTVFGTNITDKKYFSSVVETSVTTWGNYGNPSVFGVKFDTKW